MRFERLLILMLLMLAGATNLKAVPTSPGLDDRRTRRSMLPSDEGSLDDKWANNEDMKNYVENEWRATEKLLPGEVDPKIFKVDPLMIPRLDLSFIDQSSKKGERGSSRRTKASLKISQSTNKPQRHAYKIPAAERRAARAAHENRVKIKARTHELVQHGITPDHFEFEQWMQKSAAEYRRDLKKRQKKVHVTRQQRQ